MTLLALRRAPRQHAIAGEKITSVAGEETADSAGCTPPVLRFASKPTQGLHDTKGSQRYAQASCVQASCVEGGCAQISSAQISSARVSRAQVSRAQASRQRPHGLADG